MLKNQHITRIIADILNPLNFSNYQLSWDEYVYLNKGRNRGWWGLI